MISLEHPIVVALGGNAISRADEEGNIRQQFRAARQTAKLLVDLIERGGKLLITHGNGPQVGNMLRRVELAAHEVYTLPLDVCGADTQGGMGYMIAQCINNELRRRQIDVTANAIVTSVEVDRDDPEFENPTKPIGQFYQPNRAIEMQRRYGWRMVEARRNHKFRRVVPSPMPRRIIEERLIRECVEAGDLVIAGGGGGVPVTCDRDGNLVGVEGVIDKDRTSGLLALAIGAPTFVIATGVRKVAINYGEPGEQFLDQLTAGQARKLQSEGQFPPGSMGPKIDAALRFLEESDQPDARVIICDLEHLLDAIDGQDGTHIVAD